MFYLDLFRTLQEERVEYLVVDGLAINLHGVERATMDVDLVLAMDDANLRRFLAAATRLTLTPSLPVPIECSSAPHCSNYRTVSAGKSRPAPTAR
jgi:hypothetical protein